MDGWIDPTSTLAAVTPARP
uniref:Uncharacterized protein n=1 Tax=Leersia perrieri TaxID=77586 RepID=A0A0D9V5F4_9ORYZ